MATISLNIDPKIAKTYQEYSPQKKEQIQFLLNLLFQRTLEEDTLNNITNAIRQEAQANGLTPEILAILLENDETETSP
ncbi:MAG: hypothetical protein VKN60_10775 [Cyanobacteriota bacterium]|nr:hypothetical protein [Cyanobacteriota bacterium]